MVINKEKEREKQEKQNRIAPTIDSKGIEIDIFNCKPTQSHPEGLNVLSTIINGKHYRGFVVESEIEGKLGGVFKRKYATMKLCSWKQCRRCKDLAEKEQKEING